MNIKRILLSVLAISTILCTTSGVLAFDSKTDATVSSVEMGDSLLRYAQISSLKPIITASGSIKATLVLQRSYDFSMTLELQQYIDGSWEYVDSWDTDGNYSGTISETCSLERGKKYRACVSVTVYDDNGKVVESTTKYSTSVTAS